MSAGVFADQWDYAAMLSDISDGRRFAYARYNDGEWNCIFGRQGSNVGGEHQYDATLGGSLREALYGHEECGYHIGTFASMYKPGKWWASERFIEFTSNSGLRFCDSMILHRASEKGALGLFFEAMRGKSIAMVGHGGMLAMRPWLGDFELVCIPSSDCWRARAMIEPRVLDAARQYDVVLFTCSMPAKVWIRQAWDAGCKASLIDVGSVFDPYIGRMSRVYMRDGKAQLAEKLYG